VGPVRPSPLLLTVALVVGLASCGSDDPSVRAAQADRPVVVTALRPLAEVVEEIAGDAVVVIDLTPVGESPHELALTRRSREEVRDADLAIVVGKGFQPDLERAAAAREGATLDVLAELALPDRPGGAEGPVEPHVWLDPTIMGSIITAIGASLAEVAPDDAGRILDHAAEMVEDVVRLDSQLRQGLQDCERTVIASQHESFGWLAARYGLTNVGFDAALPDEDPEPDPDHAADVLSLVDDGAVGTLFIETLSPTSWLEVIADERGLDAIVLNPYEGLTPREAETEATYRTVMLYNLEALQDALGCS
jgi:zinc transport system substrate-binding protein